MTIYMCCNLGIFDEIEYPEIPYKINNSTIQNYEPISTCVNKCSDKGGRSPPFFSFSSYNIAARREGIFYS